MAGTGLVLYGFVIGHMVGNLQIYLGPKAINDYAEFLQHFLHGQGIWLARGSLLVAVGLHICGRLPEAYVPLEAAERVASLHLRPPHRRDAVVALVSERVHVGSLAIHHDDDLWQQRAKQPSRLVTCELWALAASNEQANLTHCEELTSSATRFLELVYCAVL